MRPGLRSCVALLALVPAVAGAAAAPQLYLASWDRSEWHSVASEDGCHLMHEIPHFGLALISQRAPGDSMLSVFTENPPTQADIADVFSRTPPHWDDPAERYLQTVRVEADRRIFHLGHHSTQRIVAELAEGRTVGMRFRAWWRDSDAEVALSNVGFRDAHRAYLSCLAERSGNRPESLHASEDTLAAMGYAAVAFPRPERRERPPLPGPSEIYFDGATAELGAEARAQLEKVAQALRDPSSWKSLSIAAYSDPRGSRARNGQLADQRARAIADYLIELGIPQERIQLESHVAPPQPGSEQPQRARHQRAVVIVQR